MIILYVIVAAVVLILIIVIIQTVITSHRRIVTPFKQPVDENLETAEKLSKAIQYRTESFNNLARINRDEYRRFHEFLNTSFPLVHEQLERRELSDFSVLYRWEGTNTELEPALLMAHWDVVPVPEEEEAQWNEPPFSGAIKDGFIHGRGSLDDKISLISILQGVETLLAEGYRPGRTVYVAFGGDEEIGGLNGAANTVRYLEKEGIRLSWVLDEATVIIQGGLLGIERPIALIGISEKGQADIRVTASGDSGHASMPPKSTAAGVLAKAIWRIEKRPSRLTLTPLMKGFLESLAPYASIGLKIALSNLWLTGPLVARILAADPTSNSLVRTTQAFTMLEGSPAENVLPETARAIANCRIIPGDTIQNTLDRMRKAAGGENITIEVFRSEHSGDPVPPSPVEGDGFRLIAETLSETLPGVIPAPFLCNASTDSRHFSKICDSTLRFMPVILKNEDLSMFHGMNERVSVRNLNQYVDFIVRLLRKT